MNARGFHRMPKDAMQMSYHPALVASSQNQLTGFRRFLESNEVSIQRFFILFVHFVPSYKRGTVLAHR